MTNEDPFAAPHQHLSPKEDSEHLNLPSHQTVVRGLDLSEDKTRKQNLEALARAHTLSELASYIGTWLSENKVLAPSQIYARHAFAADPHPVWIKSMTHQADESQAILTSNWKAGLLPFCVVLDSVTSGPLSCGIAIRFEDGEDSDPAIRVDNHLIPPITCENGRQTYSFCTPNSGHRVRTGIRVNLNATISEKRVFPTPGEPLPISMREYYVKEYALASTSSAAISRLCAMFDIPCNPLVERSIMAAIVDCSRYATISKEMVVILRKTGRPLDLTLGGCVFSEFEHDKMEGFFSLTTGLDNQVLEMMSSASIPAYSDYNEKLREALWPLLSYTAPERESIIPRDVSDNIARIILSKQWGPTEHQINVRDRLKLGMDFRGDIQRFLECAIQFSNEYLEGRPIEYGLVLGEPHLTRFWPSGLPLSVAYKANSSSESGFGNINDIRKAIHIVSDPSKNALVVYYGATFTENNKGSLTFPAYAVDLEDYSSLVSLSGKGAFQPSPLGIYAAITEEIPWAVAALVGPGPRIVVISGGNVVAARDGRGWLVKQDLLSQATLDFGGTSFKPTEDWRVALSCLLSIAEQISPYVRSGQHGGLLLYVPREAKDVESGNVWVEQLGQEESLVSRDEWLGESVIWTVKDGLDLRIAGRVVRACQLDGGVLFVRSDKGEGMLAGYAMKVVASQGQNKKSKNPTGTKRAAAKMFAANGGHGAIAIAVSSDGPVRVYLNGGDDEQSDSPGSFLEYQLFVGVH